MPDIMLIMVSLLAEGDSLGASLPMVIMLIMLIMVSLVGSERRLSCSRILPRVNLFRAVTLTESKRTRRSEDTNFILIGELDCDDGYIQ